MTGTSPSLLDRRPRRTLAIVVAFCALLVVACGSGADSTPVAAAPTGELACDRHADPGGSDSAPGTAAAPVRTPAKLIEILGAGQVGCLSAGNVFNGGLRASSGGSLDNPVTITSAPGEPATIRGFIDVSRSARDIVFHRLVLDGRGSDVASPFVTGQRIVFSENEVTNNHTASCFVLGDPREGTALDITIVRNRIHDCGPLPATNMGHGIYVAHAVDTLIADNVIYGNADRGVQLYPNAQRTVVEHNVIHRNGTGVIFSGDQGTASSNNVVEKNVITASQIRWDIEAFWPASNPVGTGNVARDNCVFGGVRGEFDSGVGYTASNNRVAEPQYVDSDNGDFALADGSPCKGLGPRSQPSPPDDPPGEAESPGSGSPPTGEAGTPSGLAPTADTCLGRAATLKGTPGDDLLRGGPGRDVIVGGDGDDVILGLAGDDLICAGPGRDRVEGGSGRDRILSGAGNDVVRGGTGPDRIFGNEGNDILKGGPGRDLLVGHFGRDRLFGGTSSDRIFGGRGADVLAGQKGNDDLKGQFGADRLSGGPGNDRLHGGQGADRLVGGLGRDSADGSSGRDLCSTEKKRRCEPRLPV